MTERQGASERALHVAGRGQGALPMPRASKSLVFDSCVGAGATASVWACRWSGLPCAVKIMEIDEMYEEESLAEFRLECEQLAKCAHDNVIRFFLDYVDRDLEIGGGRLWLVSEYCSGGSVRDLLLQSGRLSEQEIAVCCSDVLAGLEYVHGLRKVHRDVKAANLVVSSSGVVKIADFGVADQISTVTRRHTTIGTPHWMAPEVVDRARTSLQCLELVGRTLQRPQLNKRCVCVCGSLLLLATDDGYDGKADIWSLGITIIEIAELHPPRRGRKMDALLRSIVSDAPPTFEQPGQWSTELREFTALMLQKNPAERHDAARCRTHLFLRRIATDSTRQLLLDRCRSLPAVKQTVRQPESKPAVPADFPAQPPPELEQLLRPTGSRTRTYSATASAKHSVTNTASLVSSDQAYLEATRSMKQLPGGGGANEPLLRGGGGSGRSCPCVIL